MIRNRIQSKVAKAFNTKLTDTIDTFTCTRKNFISSNPATGEDVYEEFIYSGRGVLFGSYLKDIVKPLDYQATDSKAVLLQNEVLSDGVQVEPKINDEWVINTKTYRVVSYGTDPSKSIWIVQLRAV